MQSLIRIVSESPWLRHAFFWTALYLSFLLFGLYDRDSFWMAAIEEAVNVAAYASIVYFNFHVLIPRFLSQKKIFLFVGSLLLFLILLTPICTLILYWVFHAFGAVELADRLDERLIFVTFALIAFLSTLFQVLSEWLRAERDRRELEQQKTQSELRFLKSQINPHFLFNTLNNLYALTLKKSDLAPEIVLKLSDMMRYMLYECNEKTVHLKKEIRYIENYLSLEKIRQGDDVNIKFDIEGEIKDQQIAPLIFIPFIENCFKHGVNRQLSNAYVHLFMKIDDDSIEMELKNSKPDILPGLYNKQPGGIGQKNVRQQLDLLYSGKYNLKTEESPLNYRVNLKIQLR
ncbi:MAG: histidine kinase [Saprospiraceae bacterium]|nr:histidine kinase [Saprospiraceae bacterium]